MSRKMQTLTQNKLFQVLFIIIGKLSSIFFNIILFESYYQFFPLVNVLTKDILSTKRFSG